MEDTKTDLHSSPNKNRLWDEYVQFSEKRYLIVNDIKEQVEILLVKLNSNPVVSGRIKNFDSYFSKYLRLLKNGDENPKITDLLGVRIICPFIEDLNAAEKIIKENFKVLETERKGHYNFKEFGYESTHILIEIPKNILAERGDPGTDIAEIQVRTILQDAWAEVEHELVYKAEFSPFDEPMRRKLAAVNANLSLADIIFQEIRSHQRKYSKELEKRRKSFFQKIEESTDDLILDSTWLPNMEMEQDIDTSHLPYDDLAGNSIDDLLVNALTAHNQNKFNDAIRQYSKILELKPDNRICSIIYKHRGMAYFACSEYNEAIADFTSSMELDKQSYKSAYFRGVVHSVIKKYSEALNDYNLSLGIYPYQPFCLFRRAQTYYHIGDFPQALADCENSLSLEPGNSSVSRFKELLLDKLKM
ncbi:MAG: tetratricopeptide repeat protein [Treponema sp.]|jgi:putative GTP pyrophosphokinase|nr:tetratricopeptide repeat protein [Treponema sp.]